MVLGIVLGTAQLGRWNSPSNGSDGGKAMTHTKDLEKGEGEDDDDKAWHEHADEA
jgi:hypothetical protein